MKSGTRQEGKTTSTSEDFVWSPGTSEGTPHTPFHSLKETDKNTNVLKNTMREKIEGEEL